MRNLKKLGAFLLAGALMVSSVACGGKKELSLADRMSEAQKKMAELKSMEGTMEMDLAMVAESDGEKQDFAVKTTGDIVMFQNPIKMKSHMKMDMGLLGSQEIDMYMEEKDGKATQYMQMAGEWIKQEVPKELLDQSNSIKSAELLLKSMTNVKEVGKEKVNGKNATKIEGEISGDAIKDVIEASGALDSMGAMGDVDEAMMNKILEKVGVLKVVYYLTDDNEIVKIEEDLVNFMNQLFESMFSDGDASMKMTVSKALLNMTFDKFNAATEFEIPEEALKAEEVK